MNQDLNRVRDIAGRNGVSVDDVMRDPAEYGLTPPISPATKTPIRPSKASTMTRATTRCIPTRPSCLRMTRWHSAARAEQPSRSAIRTSEEHRGDRARYQQQRERRLAARRPQRRDQPVQQANAADPNNPTAVIAWMGYDAPNDFNDSSGFPPQRWPGQAASWPKMSTASGQLTSAAASTSPCWATRTVRRPWPTPSPQDMHANDAVLWAAPEPISPPTQAFPP